MFINNIPMNPIMTIHVHDWNSHPLWSVLHFSQIWHECISSQVWVVEQLPPVQDWDVVGLLVFIPQLLLSVTVLVCVHEDRQAPQVPVCQLGVHTLQAVV